ncbi:hypothetical protein KY289_007994 [Solanum tuberosum]|nr:hypothetical protein KY289_007994 [Solanum tuberosum]
MGDLQSGSDDDYSYRYFITKKNNNGTWKQQGEEIPIFFKIGNVSTAHVIGTKKKMHHVHEFGHWIMKQYELSPVFLSKFDEDRKDYVLCAIKREYIDECSFDDPQPQPQRGPEPADEDV